jgi:hypothetical protein
MKLTADNYIRFFSRCRPAVDAVQEKDISVIAKAKTIR